MCGAHRRIASLWIHFSCAALSLSWSGRRMVNAPASGSLDRFLKGRRLSAGALGGLVGQFPAGRNLVRLYMPAGLRRRVFVRPEILLKNTQFGGYDLDCCIFAWFVRLLPACAHLGGHEALVRAGMLLSDRLIDCTSANLCRGAARLARGQAKLAHRDDCYCRGGRRMPPGLLNYAF